MPPPAVFGIENDGLNLAVNLLLLFLAVLWIALIYWTYSDAKRRIEDPMLVGCAAGCARVTARPPHSSIRGQVFCATPT